MRRHLLKKIDAFSSGRSPGNPAGVVFLAQGEEIAVEAMQEIARRQKGAVSEVVFCRPVDASRFSLRYFSSECEVEFCGHATIACMYDLIKHSQALQDQPIVMIETNKGQLPVINEIAKSDAVYITAPAPGFHHCEFDGPDIAVNLNIPAAAIDTDYEIAVIDAGLKTLIVPIKSLRQTLDIYPDESALKEYCLAGGIDIILVFCAEVQDGKNSFRTRVFAPKYGYLEDPATGSGNAAFGYYLLQAQKWDGGPLAIEQGPSREDPNVVRLGTTDWRGSRRVMFGGGAVLRYEKRFEL